MNNSKKRIAVFASGGGSNFKAIYKNTKNGIIAGKIALLVTNNPKSGSVEFANRENIKIVIYKNQSDIGSNNLIDKLISDKIDLIVLAGYLKLIPENIVEKFENRIMNIHPALLPRFGGKGFYGVAIHKAVIESKDKFYIKESLIVTDKFLEIREKALQKQTINQYDFHELEILGKKHYKYMENLDIDHLDNSFIYKYISEVKEYLEWGEPKSTKKYKEETPGQMVESKLDKVVKWLAKKLDIAHSVAQKLVIKAQEKGINPLKLQQKWAILSPTLLRLVAEYTPKKQKHLGD